MTNPYTVLGITPTATHDEIRKAFRKIAKQSHPDVNPGNAEAERRFKLANAAYDLLSDKDKRARFDRGEIDEDGHERGPFRHAGAGASSGGAGSAGGAHAGQFEGVDIDDILSQMFGRARAGTGGAGPAGADFGEAFASARGGGPARGSDRRVALNVDFLEAAVGAVKRITLPEGRVLDISIPPGAEDGQVLRLKGQGAPGAGRRGAAGDLMIELAVGTHPLFKRVGPDILLDLPITLAEATLGGKVVVPTITGPVSVTVPKNGNSGQVLRLKGRGIHAHDRTPGDQLITLKVCLPDTPEPELTDFIRTWSAKHPYNPRAGF